MTLVNSFFGFFDKFWEQFLGKVYIVVVRGDSYKGLWWEGGAGGIYAAPTVPRIMNSYKASVSRDIGFPVWQRSYHDHIIRDNHDFEEIWKYIDNNPTQWVLDGKA